MGIDYGRGKTNIDTETGIRYGIISGNLINVEDFVFHYDIVCPNCGKLFDDMPDEDEDGLIPCNSCEVSSCPDDFTPEEPSDILYNDNGCCLRYSADSNEVWIFKSPFKAMGSHASPCAPGAITFPGDDAWAYCLDKDWFYNEEDVPYESQTIS